MAGKRNNLQRDFDAMLEDIRAADKRDPDYSKGLTVAEWSERLECSETTTRRRLRKLVEAGEWVEDCNYRNNRRVKVYRRSS